MKTISAQELKEKLDSGADVEVINVLSKDSHETKHIPGSKNIPVDELEERAPKELPDKNKEVIVYCASKDCQASPNAAKKLEEMGYANVEDFEDGLAGWQEAGYEFEGIQV